MGDLRPELANAVSVILHATMEDELAALLAARPYERSLDRAGYRNGHFRRWLATEIGAIELSVPRARQTAYHPSFSSAPHDARARSTNSCGRPSCADSRPGRRPLWRATHRCLTLSRCRQPPDRTNRWPGRCLPSTSDPDACAVSASRRTVGQRAQSHSSSHQTGRPCRLWNHADGRRELLDYRQARAESSVGWGVLLRSLIERGLDPDAVVLVAADGADGIAAAVAEAFPNASLQRCWTHRVRNLLDAIPLAQRKSCLRGLREIYRAATKRAAVAAYWRFAQTWRTRHPVSSPVSSATSTHCSQSSTSRLRFE